jgi:enoyl-CoA hydratase/carnithine racemase
MMFLPDRLGLVQAVTQPGEQLDRALDFARKIAATPPFAVRATLVSARQALARDDVACATANYRRPPRVCWRWRASGCASAGRANDSRAALGSLTAARNS